MYKNIRKQTALFFHGELKDLRNINSKRIIL